ncbi:MAG: hypothetical protein ACLP7Q_01280 [Isosphaeraceae bacterium]
MSQAQAIPTLAWPRAMSAAECGISPPAFLLIQVPEVRSHGAGARPGRSVRGASGPRPVRRSKRRLRREVRLAGCMLLAILPIVILCSQQDFLGRKVWRPSWTLPSPPQAVQNDAPAALMTQEGGSAAICPTLPVVLSIEPVGTRVESDAKTPVVFHGYLLPDDNREEPVHGRR